MSYARRLTGALCLALFLARPGVAAAQPEPESGDEGELEAAPRLSVIGRFSVTRLARWLSSNELDERLRGIERLGTVGTAAALAKLTSHAFERRAQLTGREWLTLARALAPRAADAKAQLVLSMLLNQSPSQAGGPEEAALLELGRGAAALALAADGSSSALIVLGRALRTVGAPAAAAADALIAHPPETLAPLLDVPGQPSVELARLLGALGDERAFHTLREWVRSEPPDVRGAAAVALTRLGHLETVPLAALWLERGPRELRASALEILLLAQDARAVPALGALLGDPRPDAAERQLLLDYPSPALASAVLAGLDASAGEGAFRWTLLGRVGGDAAARRLAAGLAAEGSAFAAAHALSRAAGAPAHAVLQRSLDAAAPPVLALRAAAAREHARRERFSGLAARARAWLASDDPRERATAAWIRAFDGGAAARSELESGDDARVLAAATHALAFEPQTTEVAARLLATTPAGARRSALAACLVSPRARGSVASELLWSLVAEGGAGRPLAVRALAGRSDPALDAGVTSYLDHPDALLREHAARGLGENARPSAVGFLVRRLAFETDEGVRRALVMALAAQRGRLVSHWLALAARLDPSPRVRAVARLGLAGVPLADAAGRELLWAQLRRTRPGAADGGEGTGVRGPELGAAGAGARGMAADAEGNENDGAASVALLSVAPGLAMPVVADAEGVLIVSGLPSSHLGIRLQ